MLQISRNTRSAPRTLTRKSWTSAVLRDTALRLTGRQSMAAVTRAAPWGTRLSAHVASPHPPLRGRRLPGRAGGGARPERGRRAVHRPLRPGGPGGPAGAGARAACGAGGAAVHPRRAGAGRQRDRRGGADDRGGTHGRSGAGGIRHAAPHGGARGPRRGDRVRAPAGRDRHQAQGLSADGAVRVAVDGRSLRPGAAHRRGVARYLRCLLEALAAGGQEDELVVVVAGADEPSEFTGPGVQLVRSRVPGRVLFGTAALVGRPRLDRLAGGCDVVWAPAAAPLAVSDGVPLVLTVHDLSFEEPADFTRYERLWHRLARPERLGGRGERGVCPSGT